LTKPILEKKRSHFALKREEGGREGSMPTNKESR